MNPPANQKRRTGQLNPPATIEDLPPEMICELFKHLPLKDLLACSLVNKRWHSIVGYFKVHTLVVLDKGYTNIRKWTYPNRKFQDHELCDAELFNRLADHPRSKHVKRLALLSGKHRLDSQLKSFSQLQHLEIFRGYSEITFSHSELEVLVFHHSIYQPRSIDCPKLRVLVYDEYGRESLLNVKQPETIRELRTNMFGSKLDRFKSVQYLVTWKIEAISRATLQSLPGLKKLHFDEDIAGAFWSFRPNEAGALDRMKRTLHEFLGHVQQLKRADFQFRFAGLKLTETTLDQIDFDVQVEKGREVVYNESVYLKNYHLIESDALHFICKLDYNRLMSVGEDLPADFFERFAGVDKVRASAAVQDDRHFVWFLTSLRSCKRLWLADSQLSRDFFEYDLPIFVPSVTVLRMSAYDSFGLLFDFDFLYKLRHLKKLSISDALSLDAIRSFADLFESLRDTKIHFEFECLGRSVSVEKLTHPYPMWNIHDEEKEPLEWLDQEECLEHLEEIETEQLEFDFRWHKV